MSQFLSKTQIHGLIAGAVSALLLPWPAMAAQSGIPDFSGMWGRNAFDLEPLPTGPKPVTNLKRLPSGIGDPNQLVGDYRNPILKPEAAEVVRQKGEISKTGADYPDPSNHCAAYAPPFTFTMQLGMEILQQKDRITMVYNQDDQVRHVRLNGSHPAKLRLTPMGDAVAHYEGDTLVIDTVGIEVGPVSMIDRYGTPHSEALHVVERYRLIDYETAKQAAERHMNEDGPAGLNGNVAVDPDYRGKGLQLTLTVEDPNVFTTPWSANVTYRRIKGPWTEQVCAENVFEFYSGQYTAIPAAAKSDF